MASQVSSLDDLGARICILGPSNGGKSTLAAAIARSTDRKAIYLDQMRFLPNSDWVMRSDEEFQALHDEAIKDDSWVIEGNYSKILPQRIERATGMILLQTPILTCLWRYLRRTLFEKDRPGALQGNTDTVKWEMIRFIVWDSPRGGSDRYRQLFKESTLPKVILVSPQELDVFYQKMNLTR